MGEGKLHVAVMDFGIKRNILKSIEAFGCHLTVFPASATAEEVLACDPDGIFLSNGPGDPKDLPEVIENIKKLIGRNRFSVSASVISSWLWLTALIPIK